ncbi:MAG: ABC transporter ATP-binding protein [Candidatus Moranbacteria bacterium]|nr:ABC transporter ATP-binding protein [Candidatus Moranbacteria bacterium]MDD3964684.1 ABC transporter ATP-binding protein [Candidatus Moranbacteria bacterium]
MNDPIISANKLRVIYNQGASNEMRALEETDVAIYPEEYVIIYGPSGCGKSTLLYSLSGLQSATYGTVSFHGKVIAQMSRKEDLALHQTGIGMIFQAFYLIGSLDILDNVCLPKVFRGTDPEERRKEGFQLLRRFGIAEQADKFPGQLSGGQKQRVAIARSLINNPEIIFADEPVGNLDSASSENVLQILKELNEIDKKTIVLVTHNPEHLVYADRVIFMKDGRIVKEEIHKEKRPIKIEKKEEEEQALESMELKILMASFKNLLPQQIDILLVPFKAKQLITHLLSQLSEEQVSTAEAFLKELLFKNIDISRFSEQLDLPLEAGGAGWNKMRARSFSEDVITILNQVEKLKKDPEEGSASFLEYLIDRFHLSLAPTQKTQFQKLINLRIASKVGQTGLQKNLDEKITAGGIGLNKITAEKVVREIEIIMLLKYS